MSGGAITASPNPAGRSRGKKPTGSASSCGSPAPAGSSQEGLTCVSTARCCIFFPIVPRRVRRRDGQGFRARVACGERRRRSWRLIATTIVDVAGERAHASTSTSCAQDLKYAMRSLRRTPGFTFTAIVVAALGIGATTATFSIADHVLLRPLPFAGPDRLVKLTEDHSSLGYPRMEPSPPNYLDWKRMATSFESIEAFNGDPREPGRQRRARAHHWRDGRRAACSGCSAARRRSAAR